jgi:RNA 2',3'-cyclic 3'-phosphodiesterase
MARLFFACWPAEDAALALARMAQGLAPLLEGRAVPDGKIHLTLAFLGEIAPERGDLALEAAATIRGRAFSMVLDRLGAFRDAGVAWAGASMPDPALLALQGSLEAALRARGFALEGRPFKPHVTLVRRVQRALREASIEPVRWRATDFALVRSDRGTGRYETLERWVLV